MTPNTSFNTDGSINSVNTKIIALLVVQVYNVNRDL